MRLAPLPGEWIDRERNLHFRFEGRDFVGHPGDVVSSALWAAGERVLGRSFKYHRPRAVLSLADHDANLLAEDAAETLLRCDVTPLREGMDLRAVNTRGGVRRDRWRVLDRVSPLLPVGFYLKAFHRPRWARAQLERWFRSLAGLGRVGLNRPRRGVEKRYAHCDVLVVGGGASGLVAAIAAAENGASVWLVDEAAQLGGNLHYGRGGQDGSQQQLAELLERARACAALTLCSGTCAVAYYPDHLLPLMAADRFVKLRARAVVIASGAIEQPAVFGNNDAPGVMLGSAAQRLIYRYAVKPMERALVLTANLEGYWVALDLLRAGVVVAAIVDMRAEAELEPEAQQLRARGVRVLSSHGVREANAGGSLRSATVVPLAGRGGARERIACDGIVMSVGFAPNTALLRQAGATFEFSSALEAAVPAELPAGVFAAGRVNGVFELAEKLADGERAGQAAAAYLGLTPVRSPVHLDRSQARRVSHPYPISSGSRAKCFVDFDRDVELRDIEHALQEGFDSVELMKRYARVGVGPSQGKLSNLNAVRVLAKLRGLPPASLGLPTARPFYQPVPLAHLAGSDRPATRLTPLHERHARAAASFRPAGDWLRPAYYAAAGVEAHTCVRDEVRAVRTAVGLIDVGTLGKLELFGDGAGEFLERVYTGRFRDLPVGRTRYALALDETGVILDDGVVARLGEQHFYVTTTTGASSTVYREWLRNQQLWRLELGIVNATGSRAALNLAGPFARDVLSQLTDLDLSDEAFPYLGARQAVVAGAPAWLLRVGFVGELGYEIHTRADHAGGVWDALSAAGAEFGIRPFGVEAQRLLRLEKGHLIVGQDSDGLTQPFEAGLGRAVRMDKPFFVGQRSLRLLQQRPLRQQLVGFQLEYPAAELPEECCLVIEAGRIAGRVTSIAHSDAVGAVIGLAYLEPALAQAGSLFTIKDVRGQLVRARVTPTPFYDPKQARQRSAAARAAGRAA